MKKRILIIGILVLLLCCIFSVNAFASAITVTQQGDVQIGETLIFEVSLSEEMANVKSGSISIDYDTDKYNFIEYEWHVYEALIQTFDSNTGKGAWAAISPINISGKIFAIKLQLKNDASLGDASVNFNVGFKDPNTNEDIKLNPANYSIFLACQEHQPGDPATCTSDQACTVCGFVIEPAKGHNYSEAAVDANGHWHTCSSCGDTKGTDTQALCITDKICPVCEIVTVPAIGEHYYQGWKSDEQNHWRECDCGDIIDCVAHIPGTEADCENDQICTVCDYIMESARGHKISDAYEEIGTDHWHTCENGCGYKVGAFGEATCVADKACEYCGKVTDVAKGHSYGTEWTIDGEAHWHECSCGDKTDYETHASASELNCLLDRICDDCGYVISHAHGHSFGEWYETIAPTSDSVGEKRRDCTECSLFEIGEIPSTKNIQAFIDAVSNLSKNQTAAITYGELYAALQLYDSLTDEEKEDANDSFLVLKSAIEAYNSKVTLANNELSKAMEYAFIPITVSFSFLAGLWFLLKKKFGLFWG